jgi:hypothetical protein
MDPLVQKDNTINPQNPETNDTSKTGKQSHIIRTYEGDVANALQQKNTSVIKIAIAESVQKEQAEVVGTAKPQAKKNFLMFFLILLLISGALGIIFYIYKTYFAIPVNQSPQEEILNTIVKHDQSVNITFTDSNDLTQKIHKNIQDSSLPVGQLRNIEILNNQNIKVNSHDFLKALSPEIPNTLLRAFAPEYMFGIYSESNNVPFIILKIDSFQLAFSGILRWESSMEDGLKTLIRKNEIRNIETSISTTTISTTTETIQRNTDNLLRERVTFSDAIIKNKDVRIMRDELQRTLIMYTFIDKENLIITTEEATLVELLRRFEEKTYER